MERRVEWSVITAVAARTLLRRDFDDRARAGILADDVLLAPTRSHDARCRPTTGDGAFGIHRATGRYRCLGVPEAHGFLQSVPSDSAAFSGVAGGASYGALLSI